MRCADCGEWKPLEEFPRNRNYKNGRHPYCKPCHNQRGRETRKRLYGGSRHYHLRQKYGLNAYDVERMIAEQNGVCALCGVRKATQVDHDHKTSLVRGVLCLNCNAALGAAGDDTRILDAARQYLSIHRDESGEAREDIVSYGKACSRCGEFKALEHFPRNKNKRDGHQSYCKPCLIEASRESITKHHGSRRNYLLKYRYGSSSADIDAMLAAQGNACAVCRAKAPVHVDHDHATGKIRGILCFNCNRLLGYVGDDLTWFEKAITYVECHREQPGNVREDPVPYIISAA
jgi:recombination endonuclease VII